MKVNFRNIKELNRNKENFWGIWRYLCKYWMREIFVGKIKKFKVKFWMYFKKIFYIFECEVVYELKFGVGSWLNENV